VAGASDAPATLRVATLNVWRRHGDWPARRTVLAEGLAALKLDLIAFQETVHTDDYDQVADLLGGDYDVIHQAARAPDGGGVSIASRWPIGDVRELDLHVTPRTFGFECVTLIAEVLAPSPVGTVLFANHFPNWQLGLEHERERQTALAARVLAELAGRAGHVVVAGDLDATPEAASIRFWRGLQSLDGTSVCYRDAWTDAHPDEPGHTFSPDNPNVLTGEVGDWVLERGRRIDYVLVRCTDHGPTLDVRGCERIFDAPRDGAWGSDHFGVLAELCTHTPSGRLVP
jgi:endonuclease/exonuclease/phosphatase family metal-dependent hydrolase